ncbi:MAG TPA: PAS domain-containing protein [Candidatus Acidoferrales bacterium]|nr:PAS domain-containing protein [Candidatus Acidoferrales bacterium]
MCEYKSNFGELSPDIVERSQDVIFLADAEMRITYCNPAWDRFALANGGESCVAEKALGTNLMSVVPEVLKGFYLGLFQSCRDQHKPFDLDYECSSAEFFRLLHMNVLPLNEQGDLALINSIRVERPHGEDRAPVDPRDIYLSKEGIISMCSHCRRSRRQDALGNWDWVPSFLQTGNWNISHGVCPVCFSYFFSRFYSTMKAG